MHGIQEGIFLLWMSGFWQNFSDLGIKPCWVMMQEKDISMTTK
jgi:hypothetical protein